MSVGAVPFRLQNWVEPEDELHERVAKVLDQLLLPPATWTCFPAGNIKLPANAATKLARLGLKRGWPDILVVYDHVYGIELKRRGGVLSRTYLARTRRGALKLREGQADVFPRLEAAGMRIAVCHDEDEVLDALAGWGVPMRVRQHESFRRVAT